MPQVLRGDDESKHTDGDEGKNGENVGDVGSQARNDVHNGEPDEAKTK